MADADIPLRALWSIEGVGRGADYTAEEVEFLRAIDRFKAKRRQPHPTWREVLAIAKSLGYRRPEFP